MTSNGNTGQYADDKFNHRTRGDVPANTFNVTAFRRYKAGPPQGIEPPKLDFEKGKDYSPFDYEFETDEHPGWVFGIGSEESNWAYRPEWLDDPEKMKDVIQYGWSNWGPYWEEDPFVFEKFPVAYITSDGTVVYQKDTWGDDNMFTDQIDPANYYRISEELLKAPLEDEQILIDKIGYDPDYWGNPTGDDPFDPRDLKD